MCRKHRFTAAGDHLNGAVRKRVESACRLGALIVVFSVILSGECLAADWKWDHQAAVNYANTWVSGYNAAYANYEPNDCANFVSQCLIAGGLDLSTGVHDEHGCIISCACLNAYLVNSPAISQYTTLPKGTVEPTWYLPGDVAIFGDGSGTFQHAVIGVTGDATHLSTSAGHQSPYPGGIDTIANFFSANPTWTQCTYYHLVTAGPVDASWWGPDVRLTQTGETNEYPVLVALPNGNIGLSYTKIITSESDADVRFSSGSQLGVFSPTVVVAPSGSDKIVSDLGGGGSAVDSLGRLYLVYSDSQPGNLEVFTRCSDDSGATWSDATRLTNADNESWNGGIETDGSQVYVVWDDNRSGSLTYSPAVYFRGSADRGLTWNSEVKVSDDTTSYAWEPSMLVDKAHTIHLMWEDHRDGHPEIYYDYSTDAGVTWHTETLIPTQPSAGFVQATHSWTLGPDNAIHVFWLQPDPNDSNQNLVYHRQSTGDISSGVTNWTDPNFVSLYRPPAAGRQRAVSNRDYVWYHLATSPIFVDGVLHLAWADYLTTDTPGGTVTNSALYWTYSLDSGQTWSSTACITSNQSTAKRLTALVKGNEFYLAWSDNRDGTLEIYGKRFGQPPAATPSFDPPEGSYLDAQNVELKCSTIGAKIYYTMDCTKPTTSSAQYATPISVTTWTTIKAIAVKAGMPHSDVASAEYRIGPVPQITSPLTAAPPDVMAWSPVQFSCAADQSDLTWTWDFGDGTTATTAMGTAIHTFTTTGNFPVTLTATNSGGKYATQTVRVIVRPPDVVSNSNFDNDADGFADEIEDNLGTSSTDASATPFGGAPAGMPLPLVLSKLGISLSFAAGGKDTMSLSGTLPVPDGFVVAGQRVTLDVGGVVKDFVLDAKGSSPKGQTSSFKLGVKAKKGVVAAQNAKFTAKLSKGTFASLLADEGLTNTTVKWQVTKVPVIILFNQALYRVNQWQVYSASAGKTGRTTMPKK